MLKRYLKGVAITVFVFLILTLLTFHIYSVVVSPQYNWTTPINNGYDETLKVVGDIDFDPISFIDKNGVPAGYDVELLYALGDDLGVNIDLELMQFSEAVDSLRSGKADIMISVMQSAGGVSDPDSEFDYSMPLFVESYVIFTRKGEHIHAGDLLSKKVALHKSDFINDYLIEYYGLSRDENVKKCETIEECFKKVESGECDGAIAPLSVGTQILNKTENTNVVSTDAVVYSSMHYLAVRKDRSGLISELNESLHNLEKTRESERIYEYWMHSYIADTGTFSLLMDSLPLVFMLFVFVIALDTVIVSYYEYRQKQKESEASAMLEFERKMYRDSLIFGCDYAITVNITDNVIHTIHKLGSLEQYGFELNKPYDMMVKKFIDKADPYTVSGDDNFHSTDKYENAFNNGRTIVEFEYYVKSSDSYIKELVLMSKNENTGKLFAFIVAHDLSERRRVELETRRSLSVLTEAATEVGKGNLDVELDGVFLGEVGILASNFQKTVEQLKIYINSIKNLARVDTMTGMENRTSYVGTVADIDVKLMESLNFRFSVVMLDLNDLKKINDIHGHKAGDDYIIESANVIKSVFKSEGDLIFRVGGDEFVAILFDKSADELKLLSEKLDKAISDRNRENTDSPFDISIAYGYAIYNAEKDSCYSDTYCRADTEMYKHKNIIKAGNIQ